MTQNPNSRKWIKVACILFFWLTIMGLFAASTELLAQSYAAGQAKYMQGDFKGAEAILTQALRQRASPQEKATTYKFLGMTQCMIGKRDQAAQSFRKALKFNRGIVVGSGEVLDESVITLFNSVKNESLGARAQNQPVKQAQRPPQASRTKQAQKPMQAARSQPAPRGGVAVGPAREQATQITIQSNVPNATVSISGIMAGTTGIPIDADPGVSILEITAPGYVKKLVKVKVMANRQNQVQVELKKIPPPKPKPTPIPVPQPQQNQQPGGSPDGEGMYADAPMPQQQMVQQRGPGSSKQQMKQQRRPMKPSRKRSSSGLFLPDPEVEESFYGEPQGGGRDIAKEFSMDTASASYQRQQAQVMQQQQMMPQPMQQVQPLPQVQQMPQAGYYAVPQQQYQTYQQPYMQPQPVQVPPPAPVYLPPAPVVAQPVQQQPIQQEFPQPLPPAEPSVPSPAPPEQAPSYVVPPPPPPPGASSGAPTGSGGKAKKSSKGGSSSSSKKSMFIAFLPLGAGQFQNGSYLLGTVFAALEVGNVGYWYYSKNKEADNFVSGVNTELATRDAEREANKDVWTPEALDQYDQETERYRVDSKTFENKKRGEWLSLQTIGISLAIHAVGVVEAIMSFDDKPGGKKGKKKSRVGGGKYRGFSLDLPKGVDGVDEGLSMPDEKKNQEFYSLHAEHPSSWDMNLVPSPDSGAPAIAIGWSMEL